MILSLLLSTIGRAPLSKKVRIREGVEDDEDKEVKNKKDKTGCVGLGRTAVKRERFVPRYKEKR